MITKDMLISEIVEKYPGTAEIMFMHGMHCVGCHVAKMESLEDGCKGHGIDDEEIDKMVAEMNALEKKDE